MKAESHLKRANEIKYSINSLKKNDENTSAIVELVYGCSLHYIAYTTEKKFGTHYDIHTGLIKFLRSSNEDEIADLFSNLETIRHGRWYGGKGNGDTIRRVLEILDIIEKWKDEY
jgi:hypothetical protein